MSENFPFHGLVRLAAILAPRGPIPVSRSTWWAGVKAGRFPQPIKLGPRITAWRVDDIRALAETGLRPVPPPNSEAIAQPTHKTPDPDGHCSKRAASVVRATVKEPKHGT
jgi:prophage regulatory protein